MCEKNLEGKVLSPSSTDSDDINDETIIDSDIADDIEEIVEIFRIAHKKWQKTQEADCG
jgi:hypothetical protein